MSLIDSAHDALADALLRCNPRFGEPPTPGPPRAPSLVQLLFEMAADLADVLDISPAAVTPSPDPDPARRAQPLPVLFTVTTGESGEEPDAPAALRFAPIPVSDLLIEPGPVGAAGLAGGAFFLRGRCPYCGAEDVAVAVITSLTEAGYWLRHQHAPYNAGWTRIGRDPGHTPGCVWGRRAEPAADSTPEHETTTSAEPDAGAARLDGRR